MLQKIKQYDIIMKIVCYGGKMENLDLFNSMSANDIKKYMQEHKNDLTPETRKQLMHLWQEKNKADKKARDAEYVRTLPPRPIVEDNTPPYYSTTMKQPTPKIQKLYEDIAQLKPIYQTKLMNTLIEYNFWKWMLSESTHSSIALEQDKEAKNGEDDNDFIQLCKKQDANFERAFETTLQNAHTEPHLTHDMVIDIASTLMDGIEAEHKGDYRKVAVQMYDLGIAVQNPATIRPRMTSLLLGLSKEKDNSIKKALDVHYNVIFIQPFIDTNKRTSRLLANYYLIQGGYPPILIPPKDQKEYIDTMVELKKTGNPEKYETFMLTHLKQTMEKSIERLNELPHRKNTMISKQILSTIDRE